MILQRSDLNASAQSCHSTPRAAQGPHCRYVSLLLLLPSLPAQGSEGPITAPLRHATCTLVKGMHSCARGGCKALQCCEPLEASSSSSSSSASSSLTSCNFFWAAAFELRPRCVRCDSGCVPAQPADSDIAHSLQALGHMLPVTPSQSVLPSSMLANGVILVNFSTFYSVVLVR